MYRVVLKNGTSETILDNNCLMDLRVSLERNKSDSFSFEVSNEIDIELFKPFSSIVTVFDEEDIIFRGRVESVEKDIEDMRIVSCGGTLSYLNDTQYPPFESTSTPAALLESILENHNANVEDSKKIYLGNITVTDPNDYLPRSSQDYLSSLKMLTDKLVNSLGGYLNIRYEGYTAYLDWLSELNHTNTQKIELGSNLIDVNVEYDYKDIITRIIPLGAVDSETNKRIDIVDVNGGYEYIDNTEYFDKYGKITGVVIWNDVTNPSYLYNKASAYLESCCHEKCTITIKAIDLHLADTSIEKFNMGDWIQVVIPTHGIDSLFQLNKMEKVLDNPEDSTITLGDILKTNTEKTREEINSTNSEITQQIINVNKLANRITETEFKTTPSAIISTVRESTEYINDLGEKVTASEIISTINQTAENVLIQANKINLVGSVTAECLDVETLSAISANLGTVTAGSIAGVNISSSNFISHDATGQGFEMDAGSIEFDYNDSDIDHFNYIFNFLGLDLNYEYIGSNSSPTIRKSRLFITPYRMALIGSGSDYVEKVVMEADVLKNLVKMSNLTVTESLKVGDVNVSLEGHTHSYLPLTGGKIEGYLQVYSTTATIGQMRFNNGWLGFYDGRSSAHDNTGRLGLLGYVNDVTHLNLVNEVGGYLILKTTGSVVQLENSYGKIYSDGSFRPSSTNATQFALGTGNSPWKELFASSSTIASSDRNKKKDFAEFDERYEKLFFDLKPQLYRFKQGTSDRFHSGFISQDVEESLIKNGLTALDFAGFCKDVAQNVEIDEDGIEHFTDKTDENGNLIYDYSLRYEEFIALNTYMIQKQQEQIEELRKEIEILKAKE